MINWLEKGQGGVGGRVAISRPVRMLHNDSSPIVHYGPMRVLILLISTNERRTSLHLCVVGLLDHVVVVVALPQTGQGRTQRLSRLRHQLSEKCCHPVVLGNGHDSCDVSMVVLLTWEYFSGRPGLKMTRVYGVESWNEVGVGVVLRLWPLAPVCLLHTQASASTIA